MTNKEILKSLCLQCSVHDAAQVYKSVQEYCVCSDGKGNLSYMAGCICQDGVLRYTPAESLACDEPLPAGLPKMVWDGTMPIQEVLSAMKAAKPVTADGIAYDRIFAIKMCVTVAKRLPFYAVQLLSGNNMVSVKPSRLII